MSWETDTLRLTPIHQANGLYYARKNPRETKMIWQIVLEKLQFSAK
jgi:hypothetical protein